MRQRDISSSFPNCATSSATITSSSKSSSAGVVISHPSMQTFTISNASQPPNFQHMQYQIPPKQLYTDYGYPAQHLFSSSPQYFQFSNSSHIMNHCGQSSSSLPGAFNNSQILQQSSQYNNFMQHHAQQQVYNQPWTQQINSPLTPQHNASSTEAIASAVRMSMNSSGSLEPVETLKLLDISNDLPQVSTRPPSPSKTISPQSLV